ncbi:hypothetical protein EDD86DRAFT_243645 [Gorgonomyces haynaldii]|nr:hypothetical protein EDD86DRAFT_243645 [Gorgonomyces haynaldii]
MRTIVIPIADGHQGEISYAQHIVREDDLVVLVHVDTMSVPHSERLPDLVMERTPSSVAKTQALLKQFSGAFPKSRVDWLKGGDPKQELVRYIQEIKPDLVVMGSKGPGIHKMVMGSISDHVMKHVSVPCVLIHEKQVVKEQ